jgi:hypothetical protein
MTDTQWNSHHWETEGKPDGGQSYGIGYCIAWQRGSILEQGRNGAFLIEVLEACLDELKHKNNQFPCHENIEAIGHLKLCLGKLNARLNRRREEGTLYDHKESPMHPDSGKDAIA